MNTTPTPGDLARRQPAVPIEEALAPAQLREGERFKAVYSRGMALSGMHPEARLLGHVLLAYADRRGGRIAPNRQPSWDRLASETGLDRERIGVQLNILDQRGWLRRTVIQTGPRTGVTRYRLTIPLLYIERIRAAQTV